MKLNLLNSKNLSNAIENALEYVKLYSLDKVCFLVPDKLSVNMEKTMFEKLNLECSFDYEVSTISRLSQSILSSLDIQYIPISKIGSVTLINKIVREQKDNLQAFKNNWYGYSYCNELYKTLSQLKACNLSYDELNKFDSENSTIKSKLNDLGLIYEEYTKAKASLVDKNDILNMTSVAVHNCDFIKNTHYIFVGYDDFTSQGYTFIEQLTLNAKSVSVCVYENKLSKNRHIYTDTIKERLTNLAYTLDIPFEEFNLETKQNKLQTFLTDNIFATDAKTFCLLDMETIHLYKSQNISQEIEFIARDIKRKILSGKRYLNFGLAIYDLEKHLEIVKQIFNKYEINFYIDSQTSVKNTIIYKFLTNFLTLNTNSKSLDNLIEFIDSPFIDLEENVKINLIQYLSVINFDGNFSSLSLQDEALQQGVDYLNKILTSHKISNTDNISKIINVLKELLIDLNVEEKLENIINNIQDNYAKKILQQCIKSFFDLLSEVEKFYQEATLNELLDIINQGAEEQKISPLPLSIDCVQVLDAGEILTSFDNLYIANCTCKTCPKVSQDLGIILDTEIEKLNLSNKISPTIQYLNRLNKFKAFNNLTMFRDSLTITMSIENDSEISTLTKELTKKINISTKGKTTGLEILNADDVDKINTISPLSKWDFLESAYTRNLIQNKNVVDILKNYNLEPKTAKTTLDTEQPTIKQISCSALETYFACPMKYFLNNVLHLKESKTNELELVEIGNILHKLAQDFYSMDNRQSIDIKEYSKKMINSYMLKDNKLKTLIDSPITTNLYNEGARFLEKLLYLEKYSAFVPVYQELEFGIGKKHPPFKLNNSTLLQGKVDRIDIFKNYIEIIDYKSGNPNASFEELFYGKKLQLFLYAKAMEKILNKDVAGTFYLPIKNTIEKANPNETKENPYKLSGFVLNNADLISAYDTRLPNELKSSDIINVSVTSKGEISTRSNKVLSKSQLDNMMNYSVNVANKAIDEIKSNFIAPSPLKIDKQKTSCDHCPYLAICKKNSLDISYRNIKKVSAQNFEEGQNA